jgi:hypothetical protein
MQRRFEQPGFRFVSWFSCDHVKINQLERRIPTSRYVVKNSFQGYSSRGICEKRTAGAEQAAEKLGNLDKAGGNRPSGAKEAAEKAQTKSESGKA